MVDAKTHIYATALAKDLLNYALSPSEKVEAECGREYYMEFMILKLFAVDFVLYRRTNSNPMLGVVRAKFNSEIDKFCGSRPELAGLDEVIAERFQKYADACKRVHRSQDSNPSKPFPYHVGKTFSSFVKGAPVRDPLESSVNDCLFWGMCGDLAATLDNYHVTMSEEESQPPIC